MPTSRRYLTLEGKLAAALFGAGALGAVLATLVAARLDRGWLAVTIALAVMVPAVLVAARSLAAPIRGLLRALSGALASFRDGDFSVSIVHGRNDELGDLVNAHNELGTVLREERAHLVERELLLSTVVQNTPTALVLVDSHDHIVHGNLAARQQFNAGRKLEGLTFATVLAECDPVVAEAVASGQDAIFGVQLEGHDESFHLAHRSFNLRGQPHRLYLFRRVTRELGRQEVATWKKVIRVISHELNNALAPISSLAHSGRELAKVGDAARLDRVFATIEERSRHLHTFLQGYATFAKLPMPRPATVHWREFLDGLAAMYKFAIAGRVPDEPASADPAQLTQALSNLLKNAHESGTAPGSIEVEVRAEGADWRLDVRDRGGGMPEAVITQALLPFYSTKRSGTGLGLALVREIVEAHGGRMALANREGGGLAVSLWLPRRAG